MNHPVKFLPSIVILRGVAALFVVCSHVTGREPYAIFNQYFAWCRSYNLGFFGVVCFFVISGFALSHSLGDDYVAKGFGRFMARRLVRIEPTYFASILFTCLLTIVLTRISPNGIPWLPTGRQLLCHALYLVPFTHTEWITPAYWTLAVEFQFYLAIGLLYPSLLRAGRKSEFGIPLCVVFFASLSFLAPLCPPLELLKYSPFFALGILLERQLAKPMPGWLLYVTVAVIGSLALVSKIQLSAPAAATGVLTFLIILYWKPEFKGGNRLAKLALFLGTISYSWYVTHQPIAAAGESAARLLLKLRHFPGQLLAVNLVPVASFAATILAAWLLYLLVEGPTHRLARKITLRPEPDPALPEIPATLP